MCWTRVTVDCPWREGESTVYKFIPKGQRLSSATVAILLRQPHSWPLRRGWACLTVVVFPFLSCAPFWDWWWGKQNGFPRPGGGGSGCLRPGGTTGDWQAPWAAAGAAVEDLAGGTSWGRYWTDATFLISVSWVDRHFRVAVQQNRSTSAETGA